MNSVRVAIVGGGLAGLAAAAALAERGVRVELFEARRKLGGRAGSHHDRESGELIDNCQHVAMGCCTNFLAFCRQTETLALLERHDRLHFLGPSGERSDFFARRWLPPPLHLAGALWGLRHLSIADKLAIGRALQRLMRWRSADDESGPTVADWLNEQQQSAAAIERFWKVVLVSALGESLDRASLFAACKVFLDGFLAHADAAAIYVPRVPLDELYDARVGAWLQARGVALHREEPLAQVRGDARRVRGLLLTSGAEVAADFVILAVPWRRVGDLLPAEMRAVIDPDSRFASIGSAPISSVHLWFDRPITELPHAVLVGRLSQWIFARSQSAPRTPDEHPYQVVISASHNLLGRAREAVIEEVHSDLRAVFPAAVQAQLLRWQFITERDAVFSVRPGFEKIRPRQQTAIANSMLAGDWTATGWPATMEGAVRSGYLAAEAILSQLGRSERILAPDLPHGWLVRLLAG